MQTLGNASKENLKRREVQSKKSNKDSAKYAGKVTYWKKTTKKQKIFKPANYQQGKKEDDRSAASCRDVGFLARAIS